MATAADCCRLFTLPAVIADRLPRIVTATGIADVRIDRARIRRSVG